MSILTNLLAKGGLRHLSRLGLLLAAACAGLGMQAPAARAVESIQLTYGSLELRPMPLADLETFAATDATTRSLETLLDLLKVENAIAQAILSTEWEVDDQTFNRAANSFVANAFFELIATAVELPDAEVADWLALRNAATAAAADGKLSILEVLRNLEGRLLVIDTRQAIEVARDIQRDIESIRTLFEQTDEETQTVDDRQFGD